jgi:CRISP-associated protein Cas1
MDPIDLYIDSHGLRLGLDSERLVIRDRDNNRLAQHPLFCLRSISLSSRSASLSSDLLAALATHGVSLSVCDFSGQPLGHFDFFLPGSWLSLQAQALATHDPSRAASLAATLLIEKLHAQRRLLRYLAARAASPDLLPRAVDALSSSLAALHTLRQAPSGDLSADRASMLGHEGAAAHAYWQAISDTLPHHHASSQLRRVGRGAEDPINASLNYGYAILLPRLTAMIHRAGLHPAGGFLHVPHGARPALALDLIEPYRCIVDDAVLGLIRRRKSPLPSDGLPPDWRRAIVTAILDRLAAPADLHGKTFPVHACLQRTVRDLSSHLRDPLAHPDWRPWRWDVRGPKTPASTQDTPP